MSNDISSTDVQHMYRRCTIYLLFFKIRVYKRNNEQLIDGSLFLFFVDPLEGFNDWGGRGYDDFFPGEVTKTAPSGDETTWSPTWSASLPQCHRI